MYKPRLLLAAAMDGCTPDVAGAVGKTGGMAADDAPVPAVRGAVLRAGVFTVIVSSVPLPS